mmetsp:Transcript_13046/g.29637  ORF Transcript_13046/g.29637 Transcript_13046/m.29637 type:complete len:181 (-) Transcript_13046:56-598(-)
MATRLPAWKRKKRPPGTPTVVKDDHLLGDWRHLDRWRQSEAGVRRLAEADGNLHPGEGGYLGFATLQGRWAPTTMRAARRARSTQASSAQLGAQAKDGTGEETSSTGVPSSRRYRTFSEPVLLPYRGSDGRPCPRPPLSPDNDRFKGIGHLGFDSSQIGLPKYSHFSERVIHPASLPRAS